MIGGGVVLAALVVGGALVVRPKAVAGTPGIGKAAAAAAHEKLVQENASRPFPQAALDRMKIPPAQPAPPRLVWVNPALAPAGSEVLPAEYGLPGQYIFTNMLLTPNEGGVYAGALGSKPSQGVLIFQNTPKGVNKVVHLSGSSGVVTLTGFSPSSSPTSVTFKTANGETGYAMVHTGNVTINP